MKLHFLGTGAADWDIKTPSAHRNFRRFSSILIDDILLCDPGPCVFEFEKTMGYPSLLRSVTDIICTHRHSDHYAPETVEKLSPAVFHTVPAWKTLETERHMISAYPANHATAENPVHFVIESKTDGKRIFYGCDGAWMFYDTYRALMKTTFDVMIFDCTIGDIKGDYRIFEHNNIAMVKEMKDTFSKICPCFVVSHLARTLHEPHEVTAEKLAADGIITAYDNLVMEI